MSSHQSSSATGTDNSLLMVQCVSSVVNELLKQIKKGKTIDVERIKAQAAASLRIARAPKLVDIIAAVPEEHRKLLLPILQAKPIRSASGIAVVAVMSKPHRCPHIALTGGVCVYCPGGVDSDFEYSTQAYTGYEPTCLTGDHEILTREYGWKSIHLIQAHNDSVLTLNQQTNQLEWEYVNEFINQYYNGPLYEINSNSNNNNNNNIDNHNHNNNNDDNIHMKYSSSIHSICTPNHRWIIQNNKNDNNNNNNSINKSSNELIYKTAKELSIEMNNNNNNNNIDNMNQYKIPLSGINNNHGIDWNTIFPSLNNNNNSLSSLLPIQFLAFLISLNNTSSSSSSIANNCLYHIISPSLLKIQYSTIQTNSTDHYNLFDYSQQHFHSLIHSIEYETNSIIFHISIHLIQPFLSLLLLLSPSQSSIPNSLLSDDNNNNHNHSMDYSLLSQWNSNDSKQFIIEYSKYYSMNNNNINNNSMNNNNINNTHKDSMNNYSFLVPNIEYVNLFSLLCVLNNSLFRSKQLITNNKNQNNNNNNEYQYQIEIQLNNNNNNIPYESIHNITEYNRNHFPINSSVDYSRVYSISVPNSNYFVRRSHNNSSTTHHHLHHNSSNNSPINDSSASVQWNSPYFTGNSMRAIRARYDPFKQTRNRVDQLKRLGHEVDKVEFIVMGGTFMSLPMNYRDYFIRNLHDALSGHNSSTVEESIKYSEQSRTKCIGITIETRPDWCLKPHISQMLLYGCTRLEIGVQSVYEDIARDTNRGHTVKAVCQSFQLAKDAGFKIIAHMMPDLPNMGMERDIEQFREYFQNPEFRTDGLKIYPTLVIRGTGLYELWKTGKYKNYSPDELIEMLAKILALVPPWTRIYRIQRDIPMPLVTSGVEHGNIRELVMKRMKELGFAARDIRTREVGIMKLHGEGVDPEQVELVRRDYVANGGWETFLAYEDPKQDMLIGLLRLRKCSPETFRPELIGQQSSIIRELHVYGSAVPIHSRDPTKFQHQGYGTLLVEEAERIARDEHGSKKLAIISGVGTRHYYRKLGYELDGPYMSKWL